jgi:hypothetical protein
MPPIVLGIGQVADKEKAHSNGLARGTAIATFVNGRYPSWPTGNRAAIFLAYAWKSFWVLAACRT